MSSNMDWLTRARQKREEEKNKSNSTGSEGWLERARKDREIENTKNADPRSIGNTISTNVNNWVNNHNTFVSDYQNRYSGRKGTYEDSYVSDSASWLDKVSKQKSKFDQEADSILAYMDQYKDYLDAKWVDDVRKTITNARADQKNIYNGAVSDNEWWNSFNDKDLVAQYGSAEEVYKYFQRGDGYNKKHEGKTLDELQTALDALPEGEEKDWLAYNMTSLAKGTLSKNADWAERSKYKSTYRGGEKFNAFSGMYTDTGYDDITYDYINRDEKARKRQLVNDIASNASFLGLDTSYLKEMTDDEIAVYNYLYDPNDTTAADKYLAGLLSDLNYRQRETQQKYWADYAKAHPVLSSGFSVVTAPLKGLSAIGQFADYAADGTIDQNAAYNKFSYAPSAIREQVSSDIATPQSGVWGEIGSWTYQLGMSMGDFLINSAVSGGNSLFASALMSTGAMADTVISAKDRGLSDDQALILGVVSGAAELVTEKFSLDALLKGDLSKGAMRYILTNALTEGTEEVSSSVINLLADVLVSKDKSEWKMQVQDYINKNPGATEQQAFWKVLGDTTLSLGLDFVGGALMGGVMGTAGAGINYLTDGRSGLKVNQDAVKQYGENTDALIQEGLGNDKKSDSYYLANKYQQQVQGKNGKGGKALTGAQIRNLLAANQEQVTAKDMQLIQQAAENRLAKLGQKENVSKIAELATRYATGGKLTRAERSFLVNSEYGPQVTSELLPKGVSPDNLLSQWENNMTEGAADNYSTEWTENIGTKSVNRATYDKKNFEAEVAAKLVEHMKKVGEGPNAYQSLESRMEADAPVEVSSTGKAVIHGTDQEIDLTDPTFKQITEDGVVLDVDGTAVRAEDIEYDSYDQGLAINSIGKIEHITPEVASALYAKLDMAKPLMGQLNGMDEAFTYGYYNYSEADLAAGNFTENLTKDQLNDAYKLGQHVAKNSTTAKTDAIKNMRTAADAISEKAAKEGKEAPKSKKLTITYNHGNGVIEDIATAEKKLNKELNEEQRGGIEAAKILHQMGIGTDYELFTSYYSKTLKDKDGNPLEVFLNDEGQEQAAYAGVYMAADGKIRINLNAYSGTKGLTLNALSHELTHFIKTWSLEKYEAMAEFLVKAYGEKGVSMHKLVLKEQARLKEVRGGEEVSYGEAFDEVVANAFNRMLEDGKVMDRIAEIRQVDKSLADKIIECIRKFIKRFTNLYQKNQSLFWETEALMEMKEVFEQLQNMFAEALVEASENFQAAQMVGFELDTQTESVAPAVVMKSENTWKQSDYVQERDKAAKEIAKAIGVSEKKAKDYIDSINSIAKMIAEDRSRLDYFSSPGRSSFVDNAEYGGSFDFSTLCKKRRLLTGTFTAIQKALPNTALTADEILDIRNRMKKANLEVSCGLCYVEGSRANMGQFAKEFLRLYKQYYPDAWQPNMADVNTPDGIEWVRINHPECYEQYEYFWNHYGTLKDGDKNLFASQQKPKLYQLHTEYNGEILNKFKNDDKVEEKNLNGGIRLQSFSDFEIVHLIDTMQIIMDMSRVGLAGQAYTKVPDFAWALGDTGLKINLSLIAKSVDENGKLIFDDVEGMPIAEAMKLRDRYSKNVGTILVAFNDEQLLAAMADDRVDFIIPFHRSQWKKSQYEAMGLPAKTKDYTFMQNEKYIKPQFHEYRGRMVKDKATNYMPNEYWDFSKSGKENAEAYLEMCARNNKRPKFYKLLQDNGDGSYSLKADGSTDGYWKLLIDFKMYDNEGNGSPQMAVKPEFNMKEANRMLNDYKGGHSNFPVAQGIVDGFVKDYKASHKSVQYSSQETDLDANKEKEYSYEGLAADAFYKNSDIYSYDFLVNQKPMVVVEKVPSLSDVQSNGKIDYDKVVELGLDNVKENGGVKKGDVYLLKNSYTGRPLQISKNSITHGLGAESGNAKRTNARLGAVIGQICKNAIPINGVENTHNVRGTYVMASLIDTTIGGEKLFIVALVNVEQQNGVVQSVEYLDVAHALSGRKLNDQTIEKENRAALSPRSGAKSDSESQFSTINISDFLGIVNSTHQGFLSDDVVKKLGVERRGPKKGLFSSQQTDLDTDGKKLGEDQLEYFENSMARDRNGNLQVVYHGGTVEYEFDTTRGGKGATQYGPGAYFTDSEYYAKEYTWYRGGNVRAYYLNIEKMFDDTNMDATVQMQQWKKLEQILRKNGIEEKFIKRFAEGGFAYMSRYLAIKAGAKTSSSWEGSEQLNAMLREAGFDGIKGDLNDVYQYVIFTPNQAKLTTNEVPSTFYDTRYSTQQTDNITNRHLLSNAFEGITQNSVEYKMIQDYKSHIKELNKLDAKLGELNAEIRKIRFGTTGARDTQRLTQLENEAKEVSKEINRYDKRLLSLEASEPLRKVIERERKKEAQNTRDHVNEILQNKKLRAEQTEWRHKIRKVVRDLDKILKRGNKKQNVKEDMQSVVSTALKAADILFTDNYGNYDMLRDGIQTDLSDDEEALVKTCTQMLKDLDKMPTEGYDNWQARQEAEKRLSTKMSKLKDVFARERKRINNTTVSTILGELADAYASLENSEQSYVQGAYSEPVHTFLKNLQNEVGGTIVKDMTKDQLESVYAAYKMVLNTVRNANKMFNEELKQSREQLGNAVIEEVLKAGGVHLLSTKMGDAISQFDWNNMKPIWVANRIGSETFGKLMNGLFKGQYDFAVDIDEVKKFKLSMDKKYHPRNWDAEKLYEFESSTGKQFSLNLQQIMSLYAFSKREQAYSHLLSGGFVFEDNSTVIVDGKLGIKKTYIHKGATSYKLNEATLNSIINSLTAEQKAYVDEMQKYLSDVMGAKGNEVSMKLYGIQMFKEKFYFPLRSSGAYMERAKEAEMKKEQGQINLVNSGFTHAVKPQAKNPIVLSGFMDVWADHCNEMSMYHSMVLPMEDFRKVYNYSTVHDDKFDSASVQQTIIDAYGDAATKYIDQLYKELNAGATVDPRETPWKKLISNFKKSAVILSGSVVVQQFSSIGRAFAIIDPQYFTGAKVNSGTQLSVVEEMKKYAPVAIIKEMGGFDTGTKGSAKSYITAEQYGKGERVKGFFTDEQYRGDFMGYLPAKADEKTWCAIWEAVKRETKAKHPDMDVKSEEFLKLAGERFSEVIEKTQVYDSVLARSANMRSKGNFLAMATAFMAEPTTTVNLLEDAIRTGNKKYIARAFGSVAVSILLNNALASIVYAMRDDDEDETFIEKYFQAFTSGMIDDINPMTYYPFLKDVWSLFQGYDVERSDMSVIADLRDALKKTVGLLGKDTANMDDEMLAEYYRSVNSALLSVLDAGCSMFGVPLKNVRRDGNGIINAWNTISKDVSGERNTTWLSFWNNVGTAVKDTIPIYAWTKDKSKQDKLYEAIISGDKTYGARLKAGYKDDASYNSAVRKALRENDPRIHEAAQARYNGNIAECKRIYNEIKKEGKFNPNDILEAINSEESKLRNEEKPETVSSSYSSTDFVNAVIVGDTRLAATMKDNIISAKVANGDSQEEAEEAFTTSVSTATRNAFDSSLLDEAGAKKMLQEYADMDEEEANSKVRYWAMAKAYPQYRDDLSEARVEKYNEFAKPAEISLDVFVQYLRGTSGLETKYDKWGDVEESVRDQVLAVIDSLPITWEQKDALYLAAGYAESKIWDVPW